MVEPKPPSRSKFVGFFVVLILTLFVLGLLYKLGVWAKERWLDPDRVLVGVHAINDREAVVVFFDASAKGRSQSRMGRLSLYTDQLRWSRPLGPAGSFVGFVGRDDMSVAGGQVVTLSDDKTSGFTAYDLETGDVAWTRTLRHEEASVQFILGGAEDYVIVEAGGLTYVLDRATGKTLYELADVESVAFSDEWIEFERSHDLRYFEPKSATTVAMEDIRGAHCRVGNAVYGLDEREGLVAQDLPSGTRVSILAPHETNLVRTAADDRSLESCGWIRVDGRLRLIFLRELGQDSVAFAVDVDGDSAELAWSLSFGPDTRLKSGVGFQYDLKNQLDLVWFGAMHRYAPLELSVGDSRQLVVLDIVEGKVQRRGETSDHRRFVVFKHSDIVVLRSSESHDTAEQTAGYLLTLDGSTGKVLGAREQRALHAEPHSIVGTTLWGWKDLSFSRSDDLAIFTADLGLDIKIAGDPDRIPRRNGTIEAELLGL